MARMQAVGIARHMLGISNTFFSLPLIPSVCAHGQRAAQSARRLHVPCLLHMYIHSAQINAHKALIPNISSLCTSARCDNANANIRTHEQSYMHTQM